MKKRPWTIKLVTLLFLLSPLGLLAQLAYFYRIPPSHMHLLFLPEIWTPQVLAWAILSPLMGLCVWTVHRWAYYALIGFFALLLANNLAVWMSGRGLWDSAARIVLGSGLVLLVMLVIRRNFFAPFFNPRLRWWENAHRYATDRLRILVKSFGSNALLFEAKSFDISTTGLYVVSGHEVKIGDVFGMDVLLPGGGMVHASGEVVWHHDSSEGQPQGFGCRFTTMSRDFKAEIRGVIRALNATMKNR
jgi:hypothetical protein